MRVLLAFLACLVISSPACASCPGLGKGFSASVVRVIDGETLSLHDGSELRLAGVLIPHPDDVRVGPQGWPGAVAVKAEVEALLLGRTIDVSFGSERRDRYGRHVGHVSWQDGERASWLQEHLLAQGLARVMTRADDNFCEAEMLAAEQKAREARLGLWRDAAYAIRQTSDLDALVALAGTFQVVEGRLAEVRRTGRGLRLEFADKGKYGVVAIVPVARAKTGSGGGVRVGEPQKGQRVRLRGWLEERAGRPMLDLTLVGTREVLE